jgi:hypothetical protein
MVRAASSSRKTPSRVIEITRYRGDMNLAIVDIDICIADGRHRNYLVDRPDPDWKAYVSPENVVLDELVAGARHGLNKLDEMGWQIVFLTGRNEGLREVTTRWLTSKLGPRFGRGWKLTKPLMMRPHENQENASLFKDRQLLRIHENYKPTAIMAFDDDQYMWPIYESYGATVFKAPLCWLSLFPQPSQNLPPEVAWRK